MIKVDIVRNNAKITFLEISGHSNYEEKGKDIVCAGVSAVIVGGINAIVKDNKDDIDYRCKQGYAKVLVKNSDNDDIQKILEVIIIQLYTIQESYHEFIKIKEK